MIKAVVLGSWGIGESVLRSALESEGVQVAAVFTRPRDTTSTDPFRDLVVDLAESRGIPLYSSKSSGGSYGAALLQTIHPDVILSAAHPTLLSPEFLAVPKLGALNLHGSLLPLHRGTSPVNWALIRDERETGLTMHYIDEGMDTGDVIFQERVPINDDDTTGTISDSIKALAPDMIRRALKTLVAGGELPRTPQDNSRASYSPRLRNADLLIDWRKPARAVWSFIRGTSQPGLGARARVGGSEITFWGSLDQSGNAPSEGTAAPGTVIAVDDTGIDVQCGTGVLRIPRIHIQSTAGNDIVTAGIVFLQEDL